MTCNTLLRPLAAALFTSLPLSSLLPAQQPPLVTDCHDFTAIDAEMQRLVGTTARNGAALWIARDGQRLFERGYAGHTPDTQVEIASATKWLSGALIMSLVDDGRLDLDAPVSGYLPEFTGLKGTMTVRQMFSHTAGLPGQDAILGNDRVTLAQAATYIAQNVPLRTAPGTDFVYGGVSMHVAGRVAEVVGGQSWSTLFRDRIATPLGLTATDYEGLGGDPNPRIAGGARSTLRDYARFMEMLAGDGLFRGRRVLSAAAVDAMLQDQTGGVPVTSAPPTVPVPFQGYGIGCWMERKDAAGRTLEVTSPGAFGFTGWLDLERHTAGVFEVRSLNQRTDPFADRVRELAREQLRFRGLDCYGRATPSCQGALRLRSSRAPGNGAADFALTAENLPPFASCAVLVAPSAAVPPTAILGIDLHVTLGPLTLSAAAGADFRGELRLPLPLTAVAPSDLAFVQVVAIPTSGCAAPTSLVASHGLSLRVQ